MQYLSISEHIPFSWLDVILSPCLALVDDLVKASEAFYITN